MINRNKCHFEIDHWGANALNCGYANLPYRYAFFTVWANGFEHVDHILALIRGHSALEILMVELRQLADARKFVFDLYACDSVPIRHLRGKLKYLLDVPPEVLFIFVRNHDPKETFVGSGPFRKPQCQTISRLKWYIRELYNPKENGVRTEQHVIHASDYESQTDYVLKLLGYSAGVRMFENNRHGLPFGLPYHVRRPARYTFRAVRLDELRAAILVGNPDEPESVHATPMDIAQTPHYLALTKDMYYYERYLRAYRYVWLRDDSYPGRLLQLARSWNDANMERIIVVRREASYLILDGVHRAAILQSRGTKIAKCVEVEY